MGHFLTFYPPPSHPPSHPPTTTTTRNPKIRIRFPEIWSETDRNFCHFWLFFAFLPPLTSRKTKILKKWRKHLEMSSFYTCVPKITLIWCMLPKIRSVPDNFLSFWVIFCSFSRLLTPKTKIWKDVKHT